VLWQSRQGHEENQRYRPTIVADGPRLSGYLDGILMFDVEDSSHVTGRVALFCWTMEGVRFERFRVYPVSLASGYELDEDFVVLRNFRWSYEDDGTAAGPQAFTVEGGALVRVAPSAERPAATVAVAGEAEWRDYRASTVLRSSTQGDVGLIVRRGSAGYYRFTVNTNDTLRLVRVDGGGETELWSGSATIGTNRDLALTADCVGARITLYLNGDRLTTVVDPGGPEQGGIGLYAGNTSGVRFVMARVGLPAWEPYYRFTGEERLADGTRIRLRSGSPAEPFVSDPLETDRFVTDPFTAGELRLGADAVDLRVVGPEGTRAQRTVPPRCRLRVGAGAPSIEGRRHGDDPSCRKWGALRRELPAPDNVPP
jgi:hypothetical protein